MEGKIGRSDLFCIVVALLHLYEKTKQVQEAEVLFFHRNFFLFFIFIFLQGVLRYGVEKDGKSSARSGAICAGVCAHHVRVRWCVLILFPCF